VTWTPPCLFSQNFEDLYLWRLFKDKTQGFYIDVGAFHPEKDSVTKIFYDQGWSGINIEPVPEFFEFFQLHRERDVNLPVVVSSINGKVLLNQYADSGLASVSAASSVSVPIEYKEQRQQIEVSSRTLFDIINTYSPPSIDFLKIDVEGLESDVLVSASFELLPACLMPRVILLEATMPTARISSSVREQCRNILASCGYHHFFFDGLNDYYCLEIDRLRFSGLMLPPNVFDGIPLTPESLQDCKRQSLALRQEIGELTDKLDRALIEQQSLEKAASKASLEIIKLSADRELLLQQTSDLKTELVKLHQENLTLNARIVRQLEKIAWLRSQRESAISFLRRANKIIQLAGLRAGRFF
jgi:FkbM family methyltransferase